MCNKKVFPVIDFSATLSPPHHQPSLPSVSCAPTRKLACIRNRHLTHFCFVFLTLPFPAHPSSNNCLVHDADTLAHHILRVCVSAAAICWLTQCGVSCCHSATQTFYLENQFNYTFDIFFRGSVLSNPLISLSAC